ncbi:MAG: hypothetical protein ACRELF_02285 [Gemmataceae bacterium]
MSFPFHRMSPRRRLRTSMAGLLLLPALAVLLAVEQNRPAPAASARGAEKLPNGPIDCVPKPITGDATVKYDFDIIYVRLPRQKKFPYYWAEISSPHFPPVGGDLMLLHPDGSEELLVAAGEDGSIQDPVPSFDAQWVYYCHFRGLKRANNFFPSPEGADIYKVHVKSRKIVRLTEQTFTPNTGAADWSSDFRTRQQGKNYLSYGVVNSGPCPLPGGKVAFTSNRNAHVPPTGGPRGSTLQLFVMDEDGTNVEQIGHLNLGAALHPVVLKDGRIMFSSLEDQGLRGSLNWGLWSIHPDGSNWQPLISAFYTDTFHFQTQLSDGAIVAELYYNGSNLGAGTYYKLPPRAPEGIANFYSADLTKAPRMRFLSWVSNPLTQMSFQPYGMESLTRFCSDFDVPAEPDRPGKNREKYHGPRMGKVTHPAAAPDNHLLTVWSAGRVKWDDSAFDSGIYLIKGGRSVNEPGQMLLIKNDPKYNEQWPKALVPYPRLYGILEPKMLPALRNDGKRSPSLPEGTPFGLVGTSSLYKRETAPRGVVRGQSVTAVSTEDRWLLEDGNWTQQGADAGRYENRDIWGIRIVALEPTTDRQGRDPQRLFYNHARSERMRILGEFPVRKFGKDGKQPVDPDGNPDTSFLAKIPANVAWTFQTLDKNGLVLNMAQTWHQIRPGEIRNNCGGCHAHSQKPTDFELTAAARSDYVPFDLSRQTPLLTSKKSDQSGKQCDEGDETGLRYAKGGVENVEFFRDIKPILNRSCAACHTKSWQKPAGNLVLDDDRPMNAHGMKVPGTYVRLALDNRGGSEPTLFGHKYPRPGYGHWSSPLRASRYLWKLQSRRSLLTWKIFGKCLDGFHDEDFTTEAVPGDNTTLQHKGRGVDAKTWKYKDDPKRQAPRFTVGYRGSIMPPPKAVEGTYLAPNGKKIKVAPLTDEDRRTLVRWIDLGCPIDLDYDAAHPDQRGYGFACDDQRPTLTLTYPQAGANPPLTRILVGMHDYYTGLDMDTFRVVADFAVDGITAGQNLAAQFRPKSPSVWELKLAQPLARLAKGKMEVSVKDRQGNVTRIERTFSIGSER